MDTEPSLYSGNLPYFQNPKIIGYYTIYSGKDFSVSLSGLKYIHIPRNQSVNFDLNHGLEDAIQVEEVGYEERRLEFIPRWLFENQVADKWIDADFICYRGILAMLMCTPYEKKEGWIICATRVKGTIFLHSKETAQKREDREKETEKDKKFTSWGYKFEQYMGSDKPDSWPSIAEPVNEEDGFIVMFKSKLNQHSLIYSAEVDGVQSEQELTDLEGANFIELKTHRHFSTDHQYNNFKRFKTLKWWAQSFLVGIQKIICGFRDDEGIVNELECFEVLKLPKLAKGMWNVDVCMNFCDRFLSFVKNLVQQEESPHVVWKFEWKPGEKVTSEKFENSPDFCFLPEWFISYIFENPGSPEEHAE